MTKKEKLIAGLQIVGVAAGFIAFTVASQVAVTLTDAALNKALGRGQEDN